MMKKIISLILISLLSAGLYAQITFTPSSWSVNDVVTVTYTNAGASGQTQNLFIHQAYDTDNDPNFWEHDDTWNVTGIVLTAQGGGNPGGIWTGTLDLDNSTLPVPVTEGATIYDILFVVRDDMGNNWTGDLTVGNGSLTGVTLPEVYNSTLSVSASEISAIEYYYANGTLYLNGYQGKAHILVYDLQGKRIMTLPNVSISSNFSKALTLAQGQVYIIQVVGDTMKRSIKVMASD